MQLFGAAFLVDFRHVLLAVGGLCFQLPACWQGHRPCSGSPPHSATAPESVATCDVELQPNLDSAQALRS